MKLVELLGQYSRSRQVRQVERAACLADQVWPDRPTNGRRVPCRISTRLSAEQQQALLADYEAGATGRELAERYGMARSTVIELLRGQGVTIRHPRLTEADTARIVELYRQGMLQVDIAKRLGRSKSLIWHALRRAGAL